LGVPHELERHEVDGAIDVVVANGVHIPGDRGHDEPVDVADARELPRQLVRGGEVERHPLRRAADLRRRGFRSRPIASAQDDLASTRRVDTSDLEADSRGAADDDDRAAHTCTHSDIRPCTVHLTPLAWSGRPYQLSRPLFSQAVTPFNGVDEEYA